ncbi:MAG TPA: hypothetical protein DCS93_28615 [Microscillaceae bacterium]|nr:hypothetical protein [Microscillaceae bacterium]
MKYLIISFILVLAISACTNQHTQAQRILEPSWTTTQEIKRLYHKLGLKPHLKFHIFKKAVCGQRHLYFQNKRLLTIVDFTKPAYQKRLFIIDVVNKKLLYRTYVAHGLNSGNYSYATKFSNRNGSKMSSLGFYKTSETYRGKHGLSLKLDGLESGINDRARKRYIVMHGAKYVSARGVGRSWGCPAIPLHLTKSIIHLIKEGSCLFIYANDPLYLKQSRYLVSS